MSKTRVDTSIGKLGFAESVEAKRSHKTFNILPSKVRADHYADNHDRAALYSLSAELPELKGHKSFADDRFCFTRAEVLDRAASFELVGQEAPIKTRRSNTFHPDVRSGFLRHVAALFLEVTGKLENCPGMKTGLRCEAEDQTEDQALAVAKNMAENDSKAKTPIDRAWLCRRQRMLGKSTEEIGQMLRPPTDKRTIDRYLQLLTLTPQEQLDVHEGRMSYMKALDKQRDAGKGSAKGPRAGVAHKSTRDAHEHIAERPAPTRGLNAEEMRLYTALCSGALVMDEDEMPENLRAWYRWSAPTTEEIKALKPKREPKPTTKKAPHKPGEHAEASA